jgi:hypothetical protein
MTSERQMTFAEVLGHADECFMTSGRRTDLISAHRPGNNHLASAQSRTEATRSFSKLPKLGDRAYRKELPNCTDSTISGAENLVCLCQMSLSK